MGVRYVVYCHVNNVNNKRYVGITSQIPNRRWNNGYGYRENAHFFNAISKYGWDNFTHYILDYDLSKDDACKMERYFIDKWKTYDKRYGYNHTLGGEGKIIYGYSNTSLAWKYYSLVRRCDDVNDKGYCAVGAKGVGYSWRDITEFCTWAIDSGYEDGMVLNRIDKGKDYCPENCRWIKQNNGHAKYYTIDGVTHNVTEWYKIYGASNATVQRRMEKGMSFEKALKMYKK